MKTSFASSLGNCEISFHLLLPVPSTIPLLGGEREIYIGGVDPLALLNLSLAAPRCLGGLLEWAKRVVKIGFFFFFFLWLHQ